jgi:hypothetical protein
MTKFISLLPDTNDEIALKRLGLFGLNDVDDLSLVAMPSRKTLTLAPGGALSGEGSEVVAVLVHESISKVRH